MVETRLQKKRKGESLEHLTNTMRFSSNMGNPFKNILLQEQDQGITQQEIEEASQDPRMLWILDEMINANAQSYLMKLLQNGTRLPPMVDINMIVGSPYHNAAQSQG